MKKNEKLSVSKKILAGALIFTFTLATGQKVFAVSYNPNEDYKNLGIRFWEDQKPGVDFYINGVNRYLIEEVPNPSFGSINGDWTVFALSRGMFMGADYLNHIPTEYFPNYIRNVENEVMLKKGNLDLNKITEWNRPTLSLTPLNYNMRHVSVNGYDFIRKMSESFSTTKKQGINGPIWTLIALNSGEYKMDPIENNNLDWNSKGKMIDFILNSELKLTNGGWALSRNILDIDITAMALQSLAPYYLSEQKFEESGSKKTHFELKQAVERGINKLSELQAEHGGFGSSSFSNSLSDNSESTAQVIVALTELGIDPKSDGVSLPTLGKSISFVTKGATRDGSYTNNMIDSLLTFWSPGSLGKQNIGGFKHVTEGNDGGGGSGTMTNGMASDQAAYGLVAYQRFLTNQTSLQNFSDQKNKAYQSFKANPVNLTYSFNGNNKIKETSYLATTKIDNDAFSPKGKKFKNWNTTENGSGAVYVPEEILSIPDNDITLYAQYDNINFHLTLDSNDGILSQNVPKQFTVDDGFALPTAEGIKKEGNTFEGWYIDKEFKGKPIKEISVGTTENLTLYAKWEKIDDSVNKVINDINAIGEISLDKTALIKYARANFEELDNRQQEKVTNINQLIVAEKTINELISRSTEEERETAFIKEVTEAINNIGNVSLEKKEDIKKARAFFNFLGTYQSKLEKTTLDKLTHAESDLSILEIKEVEKTIDDIKLPIDLDSKLSIVTARHSYDALSPIQKQLVKNVEKLNNAEKTYKEIESSAQEEERIKALIEATETAIKNIGDVTLQSGPAIELAKNLYNSLDESIKSSISNITTLIKAEEAYTAVVKQKELDDQSAIDEVIKSINSIGKPELSKKEIIENARINYEKLDLELKTKFPSDTLKTLEFAEVSLKILLQEEEQLKKQGKELEKDIFNYPLAHITADSKNDIDKLTARLVPLEKYVSKQAKQQLNKLKQQVELKTKDKNNTQDKKAANLVSKLINDLVLGNEEKGQQVIIGANHTQAVDQANQLFNHLSDHAKTFVTSEEKAKLDKANESVHKIKSVIQLIKDLPELSELNKSNMDKVVEAKRHFEALTLIEQNEVENKDKLDKAIKKMEINHKTISNRGTANYRKSQSTRGGGATRKPIPASKRNRVFPKTGEEFSYQLSSLGIAVLGSLYFWRKKEDKDVTL